MSEQLLELLQHEAEPMAGVPTREGFFLCLHCHHVAHPSQREIDSAENAPAGALIKLKCRGCHKHEVIWKVPMPARAAKKPRHERMLDAKQVHAGFAALKRELAAI
jgi:hypothetical protein